MGSRNYAQVAPTPETIALNAYIFMYGGHSLVTPHVALKQLWWTDERIEAKITRPFVLAKLRGQERDFLDRPLAFGEGLTDDTYMDWILKRARRLFLVLVEIGVPDQIFGCIDDSWTDDDLPLPLEDISSLELSYQDDEALNKRFYNTQFLYLLRQLKRGAHIDYGLKEHIPMEYVNTLPPAVTLQPFDRVHFPGRPDDVFMRRKYALTDKETGLLQRDQFMRDVRRAKGLNHEHIATLWASYTSEDAAYVLSDFVPEHTLATFIEHRTPPQFTRLNVAQRKVLLCEWMHCLADAIAFLHDRGTPHTAIRPSNIWVDKENRIALADVGSFRSFQKGKKSPKTEAHDYAAPESQPNHSLYSYTLSMSSPTLSNVGTASTVRRPRTTSSSTADSSTFDAGDSSRSNSFCANSNTESQHSPITPVTPDYQRSSGYSFPAPYNVKNFSRVTPVQPQTPTTVSAVPSSFPSLRADPTFTTLQDTAADIFSLGCVYLDLITFLLKGKLTDFTKFRSTPAATSSAKPRPSAANAANRSDTKGDTSFYASLAANPVKLTAWLDILRASAHAQTSSSSSNSSSSKKSTSSSSSAAAKAAAADAHTTQHILRAVPALLALVSRMLSPVPALRPCAAGVRDAVLAMLQRELEPGAAAGLLGRKLCCEGREWGSGAGVEGFAFGLEGEGEDAVEGEGGEDQEAMGGEDLPFNSGGNRDDNHDGHDDYDDYDEDSHRAGGDPESDGHGLATLRRRSRLISVLERGRAGVLGDGPAGTPKLAEEEGDATAEGGEEGDGRWEGWGQEEDERADDNESVVDAWWVDEEAVRQRLGPHSKVAMAFTDGGKKAAAAAAGPRSSAISVKSASGAKMTMWKRAFSRAR